VRVNRENWQDQSAGESITGRARRAFNRGIENIGERAIGKHHRQIEDGRARQTAGMQSCNRRGDNDQSGKNR